MRSGRDMVRPAVEEEPVPDICCALRVRGLLDADALRGDYMPPAGLDEIIHPWLRRDQPQDVHRASMFFYILLISWTYCLI